MTDGGRRRRATPLVAGGRGGPVALVVDDDGDMREMLRLSLSLEGWSVIEAPSGEEALEQWRRAAPDVVLLDQRLSGMSGLECAALLRQRSSDARIVLFTGYLDAEVSREARRLRLLPLDKLDHTRLVELLGVLADQVRRSAVPVG